MIAGLQHGQDAATPMPLIDPLAQPIPGFGPMILVPFAITVGLSFLIGLELHRYLRSEGPGLGFGTARTLTLIGTAGFLFALLDTHYWLYLLGFASLTVWLALYYRERLRSGEGGLLVPLIALLTYLLGPLTLRTPFWFPILLATLILLILTEKPRIRRFEDWLPEGEVTTVLKFVIMAGIILPLLPAQQIASFIPVTYRQTWMAVVAVSAISYLSYLAQAYIFKRRGLLLTGVLGGLYSSTAATFVIGKQARRIPHAGTVSAALVLATAMMYVRLFVLALILAPHMIGRLAPVFGAGAVVSALAAGGIWLLFARQEQGETTEPPHHPLELRTALVFAALFVLFASLTTLVLNHYGIGGLKTLSLVVGFTDIDPFILSLFGGHYAVAPQLIVTAVIVASGSNNLLKSLYAAGMARNRAVMPAVAVLVALALGSFAYAFL